MLRFIKITPLLICLMGCLGSRKNYTAEFIAKYGQENFDIFRNKSLLVRGVDKDNDPIIFIYDYAYGSKPCGYLAVTLNNKDRTIKKVNETRFNESCVLKMDSGVKEMAVKFNEYNINRIRVDSNDNIFVALIYSEKKQDMIIRFSDPKHLPPEYKNWVHIGGNWYENPDGE